ncbi:pyridoxamine 5'-phosphate oxidase [Parvularcula bermudensis HTCC2503]|uniref:Pyridoxine/pyridoxamine 5'-phosphate oxidase n=1 Tax=Parvularcula bermudensis (strain ATCC BAA-594 / HTCC2503 / KCTC 12087) TaxID=314260 RepID=E0TG41_PARBH|nr:pyridoxamine 5'-phosphate oxidase [Parvularcula bermudensis]ADM10612.1 pyridoxamine 5'-phosphate oxidase [Parvularcula bermudensis HTCC2503]
MDKDDIIPATPSDEDYARERAAQDAFGEEADQGAVFDQDDPFALFAEWMALAGKHELNDPNAMALATTGADGAPDVRIVLLKEVDHGFVFYSNLQSSKGVQLADRPQAALCFHWKSIRRQVRVRGPVAPVSVGEADAYFAERSRGSQIGAWASTQSQIMDGEGDLTSRIADLTERFSGEDIPRPPHWSGYRVLPQDIEFWVNRPYRLHDRLVFRREGEGWETSRLYP